MLPAHGMRDQLCMFCTMSGTTYVILGSGVCVGGLQGEVLAGRAPPHPRRAFCADGAVAQTGESALLP